jgi:hypothetical protein
MKKIFLGPALIFCFLHFPFLGCSVHPPSFDHIALHKGDETGFSGAMHFTIPEMVYGVTDSSEENFERTGRTEARYFLTDIGYFNLFFSKNNFIYGLSFPGLNPAISLGYKFGSFADVVIHPTYSFYAREFTPGIQANFRILPFLSLSYIIYRDELCNCYASLTGGGYGQYYKFVDFQNLGLYLEANPFSENEFFFINPSITYDSSSKQVRYAISLGEIYGIAPHSF